MTGVTLAQARVPRSLGHVHASLKVPFRFIAITLLLLAGLARSSTAQTIRLAWDPAPNQANVSYEIQLGTSSGKYTAVRQVGIGVTMQEVTGLTPGTRYYFVVRAVDSAGVRSGPSNEVTAVVPGSSPEDPPTGGEPTPTEQTTSTTIKVASEAALRGALAALKSYTTIVVAPGTYQLTSPLPIKGGVKAIEIRGSTGRPGDVILVGPRPTWADARPVALVVSGVTGLKLTGLTIRDTPGYAIALGSGVKKVRFRRLHVVDDGEFVQASGVTGGRVEDSTFEYRGAGSDFPVGIDLRAVRNWSFRRNLFVNPAPTDRVTFGPTVLVWQGSTGTLVDSNVFVNAALEIVLGFDSRDPDQHSGGIVRNNMIVRKAGTGSRGAAISVLDSPGTVVVHNSVLVSGTSAVAVDYAHPDTTNAYIANNLVDARIAGRDGASAIVEGNMTTAAPGMFVAASVGDLHLLRDGGRAAIDNGLLNPFAPKDADGQSRPNGAGPDVGADEYR